MVATPTRWVILVTSRAHMPAEVWVLDDPSRPGRRTKYMTTFDSEDDAEEFRVAIARRWPCYRFTAAPFGRGIPPLPGTE